MQQMRCRAILILVSLVIFAGATAPVRGQAIVGETWEDQKEQILAFIDAAASTAAAEFLPPGMGDIVSLMRNSPDIVKQGLREVLKKKMADAILDDDWDRVDRIHAFSSCLEGDCARLKQLQANWKPAQESVPPPAVPEPAPATADAQPKCCLGDGDGPHFCCQWTHPVSRGTTCSPAKNRPLCESLEQGQAVSNADCMALGPHAGTCQPR